MNDALWNSIRAFEEAELFMRHMAQHLGQFDNTHNSESFLKRADETKRRANLMRQAATNGGGLPDGKQDKAPSIEYPDARA